LLLQIKKENFGTNVAFANWYCWISLYFSLKLDINAQIYGHFCKMLSALPPDQAGALPQNPIEAQLPDRCCGNLVSDLYVTLAFK